MYLLTHIKNLRIIILIDTAKLKSGPHHKAVVLMLNLCVSTL